MDANANAIATVAEVNPLANSFWLQRAPFVAFSKRLRFSKCCKRDQKNNKIPTGFEYFCSETKILLKFMSFLKCLISWL